jgi:two-component system chemotaxis response regulator CheY
MKQDPKSVLIVDDIAYVRKTMKQILTSHGYRVVGEAENGAEAVRMYAEVRPDFVTMDLVMPVMNGVEATMMQENLVTEAILVGAKDYIVKPFQTEEILKVIRETLAVKPARMTLGSVAS